MLVGTSPARLSPSQNLGRSQNRAFRGAGFLGADCAAYQCPEGGNDRWDTIV